MKIEIETTCGETFEMPVRDMTDRLAVHRHRDMLKYLDAFTGHGTADNLKASSPLASMPKIGHERKDRIRTRPLLSSH
jgi:hypothetical protein